MLSWALTWWPLINDKYLSNKTMIYMSVKMKEEGRKKLLYMHTCKIMMMMTHSEGCWSVYMC